MLKDLLEKFDNEFDEKATLNVAKNGIGLDYEQWQAVKSLAHSHLEEAYQAGEERTNDLLEEVKDYARDKGIKSVVEYIELMQGGKTHQSNPEV